MIRKKTKLTGTDNKDKNKKLLTVKLYIKN